jgi:hypothetical protein
MRKFYTNNPIAAEQFTDDYFPAGVTIADPEFIQKVLVPSLQEEYKNSKIYLFKYPQPSTTDKEVAELFKVPYPFTWIHKGDYVLTYSSGYSRVESKESFERDYFEVELKLKR